MTCEHKIQKNILPSANDTLITCHVNADFDAFAAIIAAQFLYPGAILLFPGTQEKALHVFYTETASFMYNFQKSEDIPWNKISTLVVVDTKQRSRLNHVSNLLERQDIAVHIWDHHPISNDDISSTHNHTDRVGATVTLLVKELQTQKIDISCQDATVLGLGIYADTGSFTYTSTQADDLRAAAWLLEKGMDVSSISDIAAHEFTAAHVHALYGLLESATTYQAGNVPVIIADASMEHYLGDFAFLAHKLMEMERFEVLFALGRMGDRITVVARSRREEINVGQVCTALGGGGHAYAASASVRHKTIQEVREIIFQNIYSQSHPEKCAKDYMSSPALGIEEDISIEDAYHFMVHFDLKAVPVFKKGTRSCVGILDAHTAGRAVNHKLLEFETYMQKDIYTLPPEASLLELIEVIVDSRQSLVPIVENDVVVGVVSRTDLVHIFMNAPSPTTQQYKSNKTRYLTKLLRDRLPQHIISFLESAGSIADDLHMTAYAVGGFVRDILLDRPNFDIDIVVEGNGITYAKALAKHVGGRVRTHQEFLTAIVIFKNHEGEDVHIDVTTARLEYYKYPAAMPTVEVSSIKLDLFRRDFTINALAMHLGKNVFGQLVDFFGGQRDIHDKRIRVLHTLSFVEDPSRCLRAVRFAQRYNFKLGPKTEQLIKNALTLNLIDKLSGARLYHEMRSIFDEFNPVSCLWHLDVLGILSAIHPLLRLIPQRQELLYSLKDIHDWYHLLYFEDKPRRWILYILGLCHRYNYGECQGILQRLGIPQVQQEEILGLREHIRSLRPLVKQWHHKKQKISQLCTILSSASLEALLFMMARTHSEELRMALSRYITTWRHEKIEVTGKDLLSSEFGLKSSPEIGNILRRIKAAKLDGRATSREKQWQLAKKLAKSVKKQNSNI